MPPRGHLVCIIGKTVPKLTLRLSVDVPFGFIAIPQYETERVQVAELALHVAPTAGPNCRHGDARVTLGQNHRRAGWLRSQPLATECKQMIHTTAAAEAEAGPWRLRLHGPPMLLAPDGRALLLDPHGALIAARLALAGPQARDLLARQLWSEADEGRARGNLRQRLGGFNLEARRRQ